MVIRIYCIVLKAKPVTYESYIRFLIFLVLFEMKFFIIILGRDSYLESPRGLGGGGVWQNGNFQCDVLQVQLLSTGEENFGVIFLLTEVI